VGFLKKNLVVFFGSFFFYNNPACKGQVTQSTTTAHNLVCSKADICLPCKNLWVNAMS